MNEFERCHGCDQFLVRDGGYCFHCEAESLEPTGQVDGIVPYARKGR